MLEAASTTYPDIIEDNFYQVYSTVILPPNDRSLDELIFYGHTRNDEPSESKHAKMSFNYSQIISAILPIPSHFWIVAADFPVFTLCEGTEKPADSFELLREKNTNIAISTTENANIKSVTRFLNLPPLWKSCLSCI